MPLWGIRRAGLYHPNQRRPLNQAPPASSRGCPYRLKRPMKARTPSNAFSLIIRWVIVCICLPSAFFLFIAFLAIPSEGLDATAQSIGYIFVIAIVLAVPGSIVGVLLGTLDWWLIRRIADRPDSNVPVMIATLFMGLSLATAVLLLQFYLSYDISFVGAITVTGALMAVPFFLCWYRYKRISKKLAVMPEEE
jgi:hypothetical protein